MAAPVDDFEEYATAEAKHYTEVRKTEKEREEARVLNKELKANGEKAKKLPRAMKDWNEAKFAKHRHELVDNDSASSGDDSGDDKRDSECYGRACMLMQRTSFLFQPTPRPC
jgi:hypothetical protein